jgi:hypothetical protein
VLLPVVLSGSAPSSRSEMSHADTILVNEEPAVRLIADR